MRASFVRAADFSLLVKILFLWFFILLCKYGSVWSVLEGRLIFFFLPNILDSLGINARRKISKNLKHSVAVLKRSEHRIYTANNKKFKVLTRTARRRWWRRRSNGSRRTRSLRRLMAATGLCNSGSPTNPFLLFSRGGPHKKNARNCCPWPWLTDDHDGSVFLCTSDSWMVCACVQFRSNV